MGTRTDWVDYAKAIGIMLVVYGHVARGLSSAGIVMSESTFRLADSVVYSFHMPLFFFLSGLFFYHSLLKRGGVGLTLNKIDTILYPYLIWSLLQGVIEALMSNYVNGNVTFSEVFRLWQPRAQFWFLFALFFVFVVSIPIYYFISKRYVGLIFLLAGVFYVNTWVLPYTLITFYLTSNLVFFALGIAFTKYDLGKMFSSNLSLLITMLVFVFSQYIFHGYLGKTYTDIGVESLFLACISILFVVSFSAALSKNPSRFLVYIGSSSMAIYLMHIIAGSGTRVVLTKVFAVNDLSIHLVVGCIGGVLLPLLALKAINKLNIQYLFSAPISKCLEIPYNKLLRKVER